MAEAGLVTPKTDAEGYMYFDDVDIERLSLILSLKNDWGYSLSTLRNQLFGGIHHRTCEIHHSM